MTLTRWDPFRELEDVHSRLSRVFGRSPLQRAGNEELTFPDWQPSVDIKETPEAFVIKAELPDVKKEDIRVTVDKQVLTLRGERKSEKEQKDTKIHRIERSYGSFMRSFVLPDNVKPEAIQAEKQGRPSDHQFGKNGSEGAEERRGQGRLNDAEAVTGPLRHVHLSSG